MTSAGRLGMALARDLQRRRAMLTLVCPDCETARVVRATVFDGAFWVELVTIAVPLAIVGICSLLLYRIGRGGPQEPPRAKREP